MDELKNSFDETLRGKLQSEKFEFREEYWNEAATMVRAQNAGRVWKWVSFGLTIVVLSLTLWISLTKPGSGEIVNENIEQPQQENPQIIASNDQPSSSEINIPEDDNSIASGQENSIASENTTNTNSSASETGSSNSSSSNSLNPASTSSSSANNSGSSSSTGSGESGVTPESGPGASTSSSAGSGNANIGSSNSSGNTSGTAGSGSRNDGIGITPSIANQIPDQDLERFELPDFSFGKPLSILFKPLWFFDNPNALKSGSTNFLLENSKPSKTAIQPPSRSKLSIGAQITGGVQLNNSNVVIDEELPNRLGASQFPVTLKDYQIQNSSFVQGDIRAQWNGLGVMIGAGYSTIRETFEVSGQAVNYSFDTSIVLLSMNYGPNGDYWLLGQDVDTVDQQVVKYFEGEKFQNRVSYLNVPIQGYFQLPFRNRWNAMIGGGVNFRIPTNTQIHVLDSSGMAFNIIEKPSSGTMLTYQATAQIGYRLANNLDINARAVINMSTVGLHETWNYKYSSQRFGIGLTYWIKN